MALVTDKLIFMHVPKTAGIYFRHIFKVCNIKHWELGDQHSHFPEILKYESPDFFQSRKTISFIRHPLSWYQSRWAFRVKHGWKAQHPLDFNCASNHFPTFVDNLLRYKPDGWLTWEYEMFVESVPGGIDFVGKVENLVEDSITALKLAGEVFSENAVRSIPRVNDSDMDGKSSSQLALYDDELKLRVLKAEEKIIKKYYQ